MIQPRFHLVLTQVLESRKRPADRNRPPPEGAKNLRTPGTTLAASIQSFHPAQSNAK